MSAISGSNLMGLMKKAQEIQEEIANLEATGSAGAGLVTVTLNGQGHMKGLKIDASLAKAEEIEILEDLILAAHNEAKAKIESEMAEKTQKMTGGLPIPPGIKFPF